MKTVQILEPDDTVDPEDWCRPLVLISMSGGHSDGYSFKNAYSGTPENNVKWVKVKDQFGPIWFGKMTRVINYEIGMRYEFVRGDLPSTHILSMKDYTCLSKELTGK